MILAFSSAFDEFSVSLGGFDGVINCLAVFPRLSHRDELSPQVKRLFAPEVKLVAVAKGPGSFTGLRVGVALAKGLAMAAGIKAVGVSCLQARALATFERDAMKVKGSGKKVTALLPAGAREAYAQKFEYPRKLGEPPRPLGEPKLLKNRPSPAVPGFDATHVLKLATVLKPEPPSDLKPFYLGGNY